MSFRRQVGLGAGLGEGQEAEDGTWVKVTEKTSPKSDASDSFLQQVTIVPSVSTFQ